MSRPVRLVWGQGWESVVVVVLSEIGGLGKALANEKRVNRANAIAVLKPEGCMTFRKD